MIQQLWIQYPGSALEMPVMASGDVITITLPRHEPLHYLVYVAEHIGDTWHAHITAAGKGGCRPNPEEVSRYLAVQKRTLLKRQGKLENSDIGVPQAVDSQTKVISI